MLVLGRELDRRRLRARTRLGLATTYARTARLRARNLSKDDVRACIGAKTKREIATLIADAYPELAVHLPRPRCLWESEKEAMWMFGAVGMTLTAHIASTEEGTSNSAPHR